MNTSPPDSEDTQIKPGTQPDSSSDRTQIIRWLVVAIVVWGIVLAVGAWRLNHNPMRPVVVLAWVRQRRLSQRR
jgi:hypothetical protein